MTIERIVFEYKAKLLVLGLLFILVIVLFLPVVYNHVAVFATDYGTHIEFAKKIISSGGVIESPHFLFQLLIIGAHILIPSASYQFLGILVGVASYIFLGFVLYGLIRSTIKEVHSYKAEIISISFVLVLMLVAPIFFLISWLDHHFVFGYLYSGNIYHNPTLLIIKPLSVLLNLMAVQIYMKQDVRTSPIQILVPGILTLLSALAKPSYLICLLPALVFLSALRVYRKEPLNWKLLVFGFVLPMIAILIWQYKVTYSSDAITLERAQIIFAPFVVLSHASAYLFLKFILSILFPLCVYFSYFKKTVRDVGVNLAWLTFLVGASYAYFFAEEGDRLFDGNFVWSGQIALFVLFVMSVNFFIKQNVCDFLEKPFNKFEKKFFGCIVVLGMHLIGGIIWYFVNSPFSSVNPRLWW